MGLGNLRRIVKQYWAVTVIPTCCALNSLPSQYVIFITGATLTILLGKYCDKKVSLSMTRFRDKSALYGKELKPGEPPSWP
ncbi:hypothetical protein ANTPLA_LOCUS3243 [Anthophora plagiata]